MHDEPDFPEDEFGNRRRDHPVRSIWDADQSDNPAEGYEYEPPSKVPTDQFKPWSGGGNPWWGAPTEENRDRLNKLRRSDGMPVAPRGEYSDSMSERRQVLGDWLKSKFGTQSHDVMKDGKLKRKP